MADKKLVTYDCTLTFTFQTKNDDFLNGDFNFGHLSLVMDSFNGGTVTLSDISSDVPHPFIICDLKNALFQCSPVGFVDLTSEDVFEAVMVHQNFESLSDCVFSYQRLKGSRFFLGVKERSLNEKKEIKSPQKSEKFQRRCRNKKS